MVNYQCRGASRLHLPWAIDDLPFTIPKWLARKVEMGASTMFNCGNNTNQPTPQIIYGSRNNIQQ